MNCAPSSKNRLRPTIYAPKAQALDQKVRNDRADTGSRPIPNGHDQAERSRAVGSGSGLTVLGFAVDVLLCAVGWDHVEHGPELLIDRRSLDSPLYGGFCTLWDRRRSTKKTQHQPPPKGHQTHLYQLGRLRTDRLNQVWRADIKDIPMRQGCPNVVVMMGLDHWLGMGPAHLENA